MGFKLQLDVANSRPIIPESSRLFGEFTPNLERILLGEISTEQGVNNIEESWRILMD